MTIGRQDYLCHLCKCPANDTISYSLGEMICTSCYMSHDVCCVCKKFIPSQYIEEANEDGDLMCPECLEETEGKRRLRHGYNRK